MMKLSKAKLTPTKRRKTKFQDLHFLITLVREDGSDHISYHLTAHLLLRSGFSWLNFVHSERHKCSRKGVASLSHSFIMKLGRKRQPLVSTVKEIQELLCFDLQCWPMHDTQNSCRVQAVRGEEIWAMIQNRLNRQRRRRRYKQGVSFVETLYTSTRETRHIVCIVFDKTVATDCSLDPIISHNTTYNFDCMPMLRRIPVENPLSCRD